MILAMQDGRTVSHSELPILRLGRCWQEESVLLPVRPILRACLMISWQSLRRDATAVDGNLLDRALVSWRCNGASLSYTCCLTHLGPPSRCSVVTRSATRCSDDLAYRAHAVDCRTHSASLLSHVTAPHHASRGPISQAPVKLAGRGRVSTRLHALPSANGTWVSTYNTQVASCT